MLPSVDTWLTQGSGHSLTSWRPCVGGENSEGAASPLPLGPASPPAIPWAPLGGAGAGAELGSGQGVWGPPTALGALAGLTARRHPALGLRHLKDFSAIYCSYC